jgi:hypothetical protein
MMAKCGQDCAGSLRRLETNPKIGDLERSANGDFADELGLNTLCHCESYAGLEVRLA